MFVGQEAVRLQQLPHIRLRAPGPGCLLQLRSPGTFIQPTLHLQENFQQGERQGQEALLLILLQAVEL